MPFCVNRVSCDSDLLPQRACTWLSRHQYPSVFASGDLGTLRGKIVGLFCSQKCPGDLILMTYDLALALRASGVTVASGFQSPMEKECLAFLERGPQPIVICPARSIEEMRFPARWRTRLAEGRLLVFSPFGSQARRATAQLAETRNQFIAELADEILIIHAEPGGKIAALASKALAERKSVLTLESEANAHLVALGARAVQPGYLS